MLCHSGIIAVTHPHLFVKRTSSLHALQNLHSATDVMMRTCRFARYRRLLVVATAATLTWVLLRAWNNTGTAVPRNASWNDTAKRAKNAKRISRTATGGGNSKLQVSRNIHLYASDIRVYRCTVVGRTQVIANTLLPTTWRELGRCRCNTSTAERCAWGMNNLERATWALLERVRL